jgi:hypothetical protein
METALDTIVGAGTRAVETIIIAPSCIATTLFKKLRPCSLAFGWRIGEEAAECYDD